jgi:thiol:disulfide interchange protein DsbG
MRLQIDSACGHPARARSITRALALSAGILSASVLGVGAQAASTASTIAVPATVAATIAKLADGKAKVLRAFKAPSGLIGIAVTEGPGRNDIVYASPDGAYVFRGVIIGSDGSNITRREAAQFLPKPPTAAENFAALKKTHTYLWGHANAKKELWIVFDPNCIYCHKTFESLKKYVGDDILKVHIIQVGFLKPSSLGKAAAILSSKDPAAALTKDELKFNVSGEEGGITPNMSDAEAVHEVRENNAWMTAQEIRGTPYLLYRNTKGKPQAVAGYVADASSLMAQIETKNS